MCHVQPSCAITSIGGTSNISRSARALQSRLPPHTRAHLKTFLTNTATKATLCNCAACSHAFVRATFPLTKTTTLHRLQWLLQPLRSVRHSVPLNTMLRPRGCRPNQCTSHRASSHRPPPPSAAPPTARIAAWRRTRALAPVVHHSQGCDGKAMCSTFNFLQSSTPLARNLARAQAYRKRSRCTQVRPCQLQCCDRLAVVQVCASSAPDACVRSRCICHVSACLRRPGGGSCSLHHLSVARRSSAQRHHHLCRNTKLCAAASPRQHRRRRTGRAY
jgi:hypothetical protein